MDAPTWSAKIEIVLYLVTSKSVIQTLPFLPGNSLVPTRKGLVVC
jgi:hypothetical protein